MIAAVLGWTKLPQWALELIVLAALGGGIWYWQHHLIAEGVAQQVATDAKQTKMIEQQTARETADLQARATTAEQAYDKEHQDNLDYQRAHSIDVRLCLTTPASGGVVPQTGTKIGGNKNPGTGTADIQPVPTGNPQSGEGRTGPNIGPLLVALAASADQVSAELREVQAR